MKVCCNCGTQYSNNNVNIAKCHKCGNYVCIDCEKTIYSSDMKYEENVCPSCFTFYKDEIYNSYTESQHRDRSGYYAHKNK